MAIHSKINYHLRILNIEFLAYFSVFIITISVKISLCDIAGLTYRDPVPPVAVRRQHDPCNPLYWYPTHIPEFCNLPKPPAPMPVPVPLPPPMMMPGLMPMPLPIPMAMPSGMLMPASPYAPGSYGAPMPMPGYPGPGMQAGFVPGLEGLVSSDGGINVLPFSDAYSDLLEKHKQKIIRIRLQKLLDTYENYPRRYYRRRRKHGRLYEK